MDRKYEEGRKNINTTGDSIRLVGDDYIKEMVDRIYSGGKKGGNFTKDVVKDFEEKLID